MSGSARDSHAPPAHMTAMNARNAATTRRRTWTMLLVMTRRAAFAIAIWVAGCPGFPKAGPPPGPLSLQAVQVAQVRFPTATAASLESGRQLFLQHCNACHKFPALGEYSDEQWGKIIPRMAAKAELSLADGRAILTFIQAARAASPMTAPAAMR